MIKVGITGGIGSGKTTVAGIFRQLGIPVYEADKQAKILMNTNKDLITRLINAFGKKIYNGNTLNTKLLASIVFQSNDYVKKINDIVHPYVRENFILWLKNKNNNKYVIEEAAILFETGFYKEFDKIITVTAPKELRINRIIKRDKVNKQQVLQRMNKQWDDEAKIKHAHFVIINDDKKMVLPQVLKIHDELNK